ncbi:MAG: GNAT family N-acetyltransferase [Bacillota bacterium]
MNFRLATENDIPELCALRWEHESEVDDTVANQSIVEFEKAFSRFAKEAIASGNWAFWVAEDKDVIIANVFINRVRKVPKPQKLVAEIGYLTNVHTKIEYRNHGVGTTLMKHVAAWARDNSVELLFLWPGERSVVFYERLGYSSINDVMELDLA